MRLVDADALIEKTKKFLMDRALIEIFETLIDDTPTAYDVEKVVAELKQEMNEAITLWDDSDYYTGRADAFESAIEIVKAGGAT